MKVWILQKIATYDGDGYGVWGVYTSKEKCLEMLDFYKKDTLLRVDFDYEEYTVEE